MPGVGLLEQKHSSNRGWSSSRQVCQLYSVNWWKTWETGRLHSVLLFTVWPYWPPSGRLLPLAGFDGCTVLANITTVVVTLWHGDSVW